MKHAIYTFHKYEQHTFAISPERLNWISDRSKITYHVNRLVQLNPIGSRLPGAIRAWLKAIVPLGTYLQPRITSLQCSHAHVLCNSFLCHMLFWTHRGRWIYLLFYFNIRLNNYLILPVRVIIICDYLILNIWSF